MLKKTYSKNISSFEIRYNKLPVTKSKKAFSYTYWCEKNSCTKLLNFIQKQCFDIGISTGNYVGTYIFSSNIPCPHYVYVAFTLKEKNIRCTGLILWKFALASIRTNPNQVINPNQSELGLKRSETDSVGLIFNRRGFHPRLFLNKGRIALQNTSKSERVDICACVRVYQRLRAWMRIKYQQISVVSSDNWLRLYFLYNYWFLKS